jgi:hypothetical protein
MALPIRSFTTALVPRPRGGVIVPVPFSPAESWRARDRWYVHGTIGGFPVRGSIEVDAGGPAMTLGPAWCRDPAVAGGHTVEVVLEPEGPQLETVPEELAAALRANEEARRAFESLATFHRRGFVQPIAGAKGAATRARGAARVVEAVLAGQREV